MNPFKRIANSTPRRRSVEIGDFFVSAVDSKEMSMSTRQRNRRCKFNRVCLFQCQFAGWLRPLGDNEYKARCLFCNKAFCVTHYGLHDIHIHWMGLKYAVLQTRGRTSVARCNKVRSNFTLNC